MRKPISQRILAGLLLLNHSLMSCYNPAVAPSKKADIPLVNIEKAHKLSRVVEEVPKDQELFIPSDVTAEIPHDLDQEDTQAIRSRTLDAKANKLDVSIVNKKGNSRLPQPTTGNKQRAVKQTHEPMRLRLSPKTPEGYFPQ